MTASSRRDFLIQTSAVALSRLVGPAAAQGDAPAAVDVFVYGSTPGQLAGLAAALPPMLKLKVDPYS